MTVTTQFQVGGAVANDALYIERPADRELYEALRRGELCYMLEPRQVGKSSLRIRVARQLASEGVHCVSIDFSGIGSTSVTIDEWYYSIADDIVQALGLPNLDLFWTTHQHLTPVHRWYRFLRNDLLDRVGGPIVVFIDEVDSVLALSFATDDFFASIRSMYNQRAEDPEYQRLTFCLLGVAAPADLIQNSVRTPFNIGREIRLNDFSRAEMSALLPGLEGLDCDPTLLLDAVYAWTSGHPYMTQRLCHDLARRGSIAPGNESACVDDAAYSLFVRSGRGGDANLAYAEKRLDTNPSRSRVRQMLHLYHRLLDGERVPAESNQYQMELRLTGLAAEHLGAGGQIYLRTRNLIFAEVYDHKWLKTKEKEQRLVELVDRWVSAGKSDDYLLRGAALEEALEWSHGRSDLTAADHEFLLSGVNYARREAEARHSLEEAARKEEAMRRTTLEEQRKADRERYRADIERERRERAVEEARSQRRTISILTATVATLGILVALFTWQYIVAQNNRTQLDELNARFREETKQRQRADAALLRLNQKGKEREFLRESIRVTASFLQRGGTVPARVMESLAAAVIAPPQRPSILRHDGEISHAEFSHDGTTVLTASHDGTMRIWDTTSGRSLIGLVQHPGAVLDAHFSADGTRILSVGADRTARVWNAASGEVVASYPGLAAPPRFVAIMASNGVRALLAEERSLRIVELNGTSTDSMRVEASAVTVAAFAHDGASFVTVGEGGAMLLWSVAGGVHEATMRGHTNPIRVVGFAPNNMRILTIGDGPEVRLWSETGEAVAHLVGHAGAVTGFVFSPDSASVVTYDSNGVALSWATGDGRRQASFTGHVGEILDAAFSPDCGRVVTAGADHLAKIWPVDGSTAVDLAGHTDVVRMARFSPDGARVITVSDDTTGRLWNSVSGSVVATLDGHANKVRTGSFSPDGGRVLTIADDHTARLWEASWTDVMPTLRGHSASVRLARHSPDGSRIVTISDDKTARLWDAADNHLVRVLTGHSGPLLAVEFARDGTRSLCTLAEGDPTVRVWDVDTGEQQATLRHPAPVLAARFSGDGRSIHTVSSDGNARQWDLASGKEVGVACDGAQPVAVAALAPDGTRWLTVSRTNNRVTLKAEGCSPIAELVGHFVGTVFSPDGSFFATISAEVGVQVWSTRDGNLSNARYFDADTIHSVAFSSDSSLVVVATNHGAWVFGVDPRNDTVGFLDGHSAAVLSANFSSDGTRIITTSSDNTAKLWSPGEGGYEVVATLQGHAAAINAGEFSHDGRLVVTAGRDGVAKIYPTTLETFFKAACSALRGHPEDYDLVASECAEM